MTVGMLPYKRLQLLTYLEDWITQPTFDLLQICRLLGILENHTKYARWARCWYFALQNSVRTALHVRYQIISRRYRKQQREVFFLRNLPLSLRERLDSLIARDRAKLIWSTHQRFAVDDLMKASLQQLLSYVRDVDTPWETPLGMIIPREPHFFSRGDASFLGGGAYCPRLCFWFDLGWSATTLHGIHNIPPSADGYVHINALEFIVVIVQLSAIKVRLESAQSCSKYFPDGVHDIPVWLGETDNSVSKSWENRATAKTSQGQGLVSVYAELLRCTRVHTQCQHLAGELNVIADDISRNDFSLPSPLRCEQVFLKHPSIKNLDYFLPSPELLQLLTSRLYSKHNPVPCVLPQVLGQFVPAGCTTFGSVVL
jgi:hypothetical protein